MRSAALRSVVWLPLTAACLAGHADAAESASSVGVSLAGPTIRQADDLNLYGVVIARDARRSIALLGIQEGRAFPYRPGDEVAASWRLLAVKGVTAIVADPAGERFQLEIVPDDGAGKRQAVARLPPIVRVAIPQPMQMPTDEKLDQARREFSLPASD